jgi:hypothetical protein
MLFQPTKSEVSALAVWLFGGDVVPNTLIFRHENTTYINIVTI